MSLRRTPVGRAVLVFLIVRIALVAAAPVEAQTCVPAPDGIVGWWPANGTLDDLAGGVTAQLVGVATYGAGMVGQAFDVPSPGAHVAIPHASTLAQAEAMTVAAWVKRTAVYGYADTVVKKAGANGFALEFSASEPDQLIFWAYLDSGGWRASTPAAIPLGEWTHVAGVYDGATIRLYVNGALAGAPVSAPGRIVPSTNELRIGADPSSSARGFIGLVDELAIFDRGLSASEVAALAGAGSSGMCAAMAIKTSLPDHLYLNTPVSRQFSAVPASPPVTWEVTAGAVPVGLTLNASGLLQGIPTETGDWSFQVTVTDASSQSATRAYSGTVSAKPGQMAVFDGNDEVFVPNDPSLSLGPNQPMTIELWFRYTGGPGGVYHIFGKRYETTHSQENYQIARDGNGLLHFGSCADAVSWGLDTPLNQWTHLAVSYDGTLIRLFVNGELRVTTLFTMGCETPEPLRIGASGSYGGKFVGAIDEVRVWRVARTVAEIAGTYSKSISPLTPGLVGYWTFDEDPSDQEVHDSSPEGNDGWLGATLGPGADDPVRVAQDLPVLELTHDARVVAIVEPVAIVGFGTMVTPRVQVQNAGQAIEEIAVSFQISTVYSQTVSVSLAPGETREVAFPAWPASELGRLPIRVKADLANDGYPGDNTVTGSVSIRSSAGSPIVTHVTPDKVGSTGDVTVRLTGANFVEGTTVVLLAGGVEVTAGTVTVTDAGRLSATFTVSNLPNGSADVIVRNPDGSSFTAVAAVTVESPAQKLWAELVVRPIIRLGESPFMVVYGNSGNTDSPHPWLEIALPADVPYDVDVAPAFTPETPLESASLGALKATLVRLPTLAPGQSGSVTGTIAPTAVGPTFIAALIEPGAATYTEAISALQRTSPLESESIPPMEPPVGDSTVTCLPDCPVVWKWPWQGYPPAGYICEWDWGSQPGVYPVAGCQQPLNIEKGVHLAKSIGGGQVIELWGTPEGCGVSNLRVNTLNSDNSGFVACHKPLDWSPEEARRVVERSNRALRLWNNGKAQWKATDACAEFHATETTLVSDCIGLVHLLETELIHATGTAWLRDAFDKVLYGRKNIMRRILTRMENMKDGVEMPCRSRYIELLRNAHEILVVGAMDPNAKYGAGGYGPRRFTRSRHVLPYRIDFENLASASALAQRVTIRDELDLQKVDLRTFTLGNMRFGSHEVEVPAGRIEYATEVDLRPDRDLLVRVEAGMDVFSGVVTWSFTSVDPATGLPPEDPLAGFLPPNQVPPEGQGYVGFTIEPREDLPTGTELRNKASIVFDSNPAIETPEWVNTLDDSGPTSQVELLPSTQSAASFRVQWSGSDEGAGIREFTIYVAADGGQYTAWQLHTSETSAVFTGENGRTYAFYSIARDWAGNLEDAKSAAEATTTVVPADVEPPVLSLPSATAVEATGATGAVVTYVASATDLHDGPVPASCVPASGTLFGVGTTSVACTAADAAGNSAQGGFLVTVRDTTPPALTVPISVAVEATSAKGAVAAFSVSAVDIVDGPITPTCTPASGATFPLGMTTVKCTATDASWNAGTDSFIVTVNDVTTPGVMTGDGLVVKDRDRYHFNFFVAEGTRHNPRNRFGLRIDYGPRMGVDSKGKPRMKKEDDGNFVASTFTFVAFSDDPGFRPGRSPKPQVDTVLFSGTGKWNGQAGYAFEVKATDQGEPGRRQDTVAIAITRIASGQGVATILGDLSGGNIQAIRRKH